MRRALTVLLCLLSLAACRSSYRDPVPRAAGLRVVSYNIRHGRGLDDTVNLARTAAVLRALQPDLVGLQEVDNRVTRSGGVDEAARLGQLLGMHHAFGRFMDYQGGQYGLAILSRYPVGAVREVRLPDGHEPRVALAVEIRPPGLPPFTAVNVHFDWVADDGFRFAQASLLARVLDSLSGRWIVLGDFNDEPGSRTLALFHQRADEARKPADNRFTFSSTEPVKEIDFILGGPKGRWVMGAARVVAETVASDHRPIVAEVRYRLP